MSAGNRLGKRQQRRRHYKQFKNESTFICGTVKKPLGSNVAVAEKSRVLKRLSKKDSVLQKHLSWLRELEESKRRRDEEKKAEETRKSERMKLVQHDARGTKKHCIPTSEGGTFTNAGSILPKSKPAWCRTEDANEKAKDEESDEQMLLDFIDDLNFDQYTEDMELRILMSKVKSRIKSLQREKKKDENRLRACVDSEKALERAEVVTKRHVLVDMIPADADIEVHMDDDVESVAASMLSTDSTIKSIHSRKSITALVSDAKKRMSQQLNLIEEGEPEIAMTPPLSITHTDDDGARMAEKQSIHKLAFQHRNPAL